MCAVLLCRFTSALTPFDVVTACIATELLPPRPAATIKKRFTNLISECDCGYQQGRDIHTHILLARTTYSQHNTAQRGMTDTHAQPQACGCEGPVLLT